MKFSKQFSVSYGAALNFLPGETFWTWKWIGWKHRLQWKIAQESQRQITVNDDYSLTKFRDLFLWGKSLRKACTHFLNIFRRFSYQCSIGYGGIMHALKRNVNCKPGDLNRQVKL